MHSDRLHHDVANDSVSCTRRGFLAASTTAAALLAARSQADPPRRPRVAAIYTVFRRRSHAWNILENFLRPYLFNGRRTDPGMDVVSFYADQAAAEGDRTRDVAQRYNIRVCRGIDEALCLGGRELAVDAVLLIGEHGEYPTNDLGQVEYPRKRFFDESVAVMRRSRRYVPLFNDKHLSYRWDWANEMYQTARELGIPLMAGSSVPLAERRPALELPANMVVEEIVSIHGGGVESYDYHAMEVLQALVEPRRGGETGIAAVEFLQDDALWQAAQQRRWSQSLAEAAMAVELGPNVRLRELRDVQEGRCHGVLVTFQDGLRATILKVGTLSTRWNVACKLANEVQPRTTSFYPGPWGNRNLFQALSHAIQLHFRTGQAPYPVERTLLASGVCDALMRSRAMGRRIETPHLRLAYTARDFRVCREMGASWRASERMPEPMDLNPGA